MRIDYGERPRESAVIARHGIEVPSMRRFEKWGVRGLSNESLRFESALALLIFLFDFIENTGGHIDEDLGRGQ